jgi:type IV pilus assembly protein PilE
MDKTRSPIERSDGTHDRGGNRLTRRRGFVCGFTLIELMIVVAVIAVLAAIAYPSYQDYLMKGRRAHAEAYLMDLAQRQQQYLLNSREYADAVAKLGTSIPDEIKKFYNEAKIDAVNAATPPTFTITAEPIVGSAQAKDGPLTIDNLGNKTPVDKW